MIITSRKNEQIKDLVRIAKNPDRSSFLAEGIHLAQEALLSAVELKSLILTQQAIDKPEVKSLQAEASLRGAEILTVSEDCYKKFSRLNSPEGVAVLLAAEPLSLESVFTTGARLVVGCSVQDPGNAGAIVRVAEAAGFNGCVFIGGADVLGGRFLRAAMGSSFRLPCIRAGELEFISASQKAGLTLYAANYSQRANDYSQVAYQAPLAVCMGSEGQGVPEAITAVATEIYIPMCGKIESLNVSVAAGIILYHIKHCSA